MKLTKFFVVTYPNKDSEIGDICFPCDIESFALQVKGGLNPADVEGFYTIEQPFDAIQTAFSLLGIEFTSKKGKEFLSEIYNEYYE